MKSQRRKKLKAIEAFGCKCQVCGYDKCIGALDFHHLTDKQHSPSYIIQRWAWDRIKKELDKCILVCSNCHREIHYNEIDVDVEKYYKPWIDKKCGYCRKDFETKSETQKYCSTACYQFDSRKVERPSKEELNELIQSKVSWVQLGKMFNVSDNAVRKWAKKYELI